MSFCRSTKLGVWLSKWAQQLASAPQKSTNFLFALVGPRGIARGFSAMQGGDEELQKVHMQPTLKLKSNLLASADSLSDRLTLYPPDARQLPTAQSRQEVTRSLNACRLQRRMWVCLTLRSFEL